MNLKRDPYFTFLAAFILAGVIVALANPTPAAAKPSKPSAVATNPTPPVSARS